MDKNFNEQQQFWAKEYSLDYIKKNSEFDSKLGIEAWKIMLHKAGDIASLLECGSNIGRNIGFLNAALPDAKKSIIEISIPAYNYLTNKHILHRSFNGSIVESDLEQNSFDLVFTIGVLIHISPEDLISNMTKIFNYSKKHILIGEYFNRTPVMIEYQGQQNKLFKRDFGKLFIENFNVRLLDYGFLWGHIYDSAGFDDITWWLFEKK